MEKEKYVQLIIMLSISVISLTAAYFHMIYPHWGIDYITIILLLIAFFPWVAPLFELIEFNNGFFNIVFKTNYLFRLNLGLVKNDLAPKLEPEEELSLSQSPYSFQQVDDPNIALPALRAEIEAKLKNVAKHEQIEFDGMSVDQIIKLLSNEGILSPKEEVTLIKLMNVLNRAVHAIKIEDGSIDWANDMGPRILKALDKKCQ